MNLESTEISWCAWGKDHREYPIMAGEHQACLVFYATGHSEAREKAREYFARLATGCVVRSIAVVPALFVK